MSEVFAPLLIILAAGTVIGLLLGSLGAGGSILAVPVLVQGLGQSPLQATTGSLVVVAAAALSGVLGAGRAGHVRVAPGLIFAAVASVGAVIGAHYSALVPEGVLLGSFAGLMLLVGVLALAKVVRGRAVAEERRETAPMFTRRPFTCDCPQALKVLVAGVAVGLLTGFLGVGGGFLVVPALVVAMGMAPRHASGTSLLVIGLTSLVALVMRAGVVGVSFDWSPVLGLSLVAVVAARAGQLLARRTPVQHLQAAFAVLVLVVAAWTGWTAMPAPTSPL